MMWIVGALYGGYVMANVLKWYWWRFNGYGYFWGMMAGILSAMFVPELRSQARSGHVSQPALHSSRSSSASRPIGCLLGTLLTQAGGRRHPEAVLPHGATRGASGGRSARRSCARTRLPAQPRTSAATLRNVLVGIVWQLCLTALPIYLVLRNWLGRRDRRRCSWSPRVFIKFNWYDKLEKV